MPIKNGSNKLVPGSQTRLRYNFLRLNSESLSYSQKWINDVFGKIELLEKFPNMGKTVPETRLASIREILVGKYRVIYNVAKDNIIEIMAIRHSSRPLSEF